MNHNFNLNEYPKYHNISMRFSPVNCALLLLMIYVFNTTLFHNVIQYPIINGLLRLIVLALLVLQLFILMAKKSIKFNSNMLAWSAFFLFVFMHNADISHGEYGYLLNLLICFLLIIVLPNCDNWQKFFIHAILLLSAVHVFATIILFLNQPLYEIYVQPYIISDFSNGFKSGLTNHYSTNGTYIALFFIVFFAYKLSAGKMHLKDILLASAALFALLLTTKRAHLLFGIITVIILYNIANINSFIRKIPKLFALIIFAAVLTAGLNLVYPETMDVLNRIQTNSGDITNGRLMLYELALKLFKESPLIGLGWGEYKYAYSQTSLPLIYGLDVMEAHNVYLQILSELGIIGFAMFSFCTANTLLNSVKLIVFKKYNFQLSDNHIALLSVSLAVQLFFLLYCITGNPLYDINIQTPYFISCALCNSIISIRNKQINYNYSKPLSPKIQISTINSSC